MRPGVPRGTVLCCKVGCHKVGEKRGLYVSDCHILFRLLLFFS